MIQGVLFDFDNTIYDYDKANKSALEKTFEYIHINFKYKMDLIVDVYDKINNSIKNSNNCGNKFNKSIYFKQLMEELNIDLINLTTILNIYNSTFNDNMVIFDGIIDLFKLLKVQKISIGIVSNNIFLQQYNKLVNLDLLKYINHIQTSDEVGYEKPSKLVFLSAINKMNIPKENIIYIGDNFNHDIIPSIELGLIPFYFIPNNTNVEIKNKYFEFGNYIELNNFLSNYFKSVNEYIYLSKFFGQSELNVQGQGGNISVKTNGLLLIKSSGCILGNTDKNTGFCVVDNNACINMLENNDNNLKTTKMFGYKVPSMETYFHSFMKKYTIHIHYTMSNIFLCSIKNNLLLEQLDIDHKIIDYYVPGLELATEIHNVYSTSCDLYFLKNHGLIITANEYTEIFKIYCCVFNYFNNKLNNKYLYEFNTFIITKKLYKKFNIPVVCKLYNGISHDKITNIKYCFPDLAVYIQYIYTLNDLDKIYIFERIPDVIIFNSNIYLIGDTITKLYCMIETLNLYSELCTNYETLHRIDKNTIQNMDQEKYRKNN